MRPIGQKTEAFVRRRCASGDLHTRPAERTAAQPKRDTSVGYEQARAKKNRATWRGFSRISGRGERIRTSGLYVPNVALYQAKLHPELSCSVLRVLLDSTGNSVLFKTALSSS